MSGGLRQPPTLYGVIDIGGTKIVVGLATAREIVASTRISTEAVRGPDDIVHRMAAAMREVMESQGVAGTPLTGVGLSVPGPLDVAAGVVHFTGNLHWAHYPVAQKLREALGGVSVFIDDDANCAGIGEAYFGAGQGFSDQCYLTISTGIGGAVIVRRQVYRGSQDVAGEVGHMTVIADGPPCTCGNLGCLEAVASGTAIASRGRQLLVQEQSATLASLAGGDPEAVRAELVFEAAKRGDPASLTVLRQTAMYLGIGIANLVQTLNPQAVILGGGVMRTPELILPAIVQETARHLFKIQRDHLVIKAGVLGDRAGLWGALQLVKNALGSEDLNETE